MKKVLSAECRVLRRTASVFLLSTLHLALSTTAQAAPSHCYALYGECKYKPGFAQFEYVNPKAPKGGLIRMGETGTFDSLNPFILKGVKAPAAASAFESLMTPSLDEPQTMYGLLAETIDVEEGGGAVVFTLNREAKFQDGSPVTAEDVVFSFETLRDKGDPTYRILYAPVEAVEAVDEHQVRFRFKEAGNSELPLIAAQLPVFSKAFFTAHDFEKTTLEPVLGSGPYRATKVEPGHSITYSRVKDYWAADLNVNRGQNNFDEIRYDMYRDENVALEAFKGGALDFRQEYIARNWSLAYDIPAIKDGTIIKKMIPNEVPQGMQAFTFNARKSKFADRRVREAIGLALDYEWLNKTIFYSAYARNNSFFLNTPFASTTALPDKAERKLLDPFADTLPKQVFTKLFQNPETDGSGNARANLVKAQGLLEEAGWILKDGKRTNAETGEVLNMEFMLRQPTMERVIGPMRRNLSKLGIDTRIRHVDDAQYQKRVDSHDFDMVSIWVNRGVFFPGNEQQALWHSSQADVKGGNNVAGVKNPAADAALAALGAARDLDSLTTAGRALDRVLLWEHYVIPHWHSQGFRIAYRNIFGMPEISPKYQLGINTWWVK